MAPSHYLTQNCIIFTWFSEILIKIHNFSLTKMHLKILYAKWQPFCRRGRWVNPLHAEIMVRESYMSITSSVFFCQYWHDTVCDLVISTQLVSQILVITGSGVGGGVGLLNQFLPFSLFPDFFTIIKTLVTYWISYSYLPGIGAVQLQVTPFIYENDLKNLPGIFAK